MTLFPALEQAPSTEAIYVAVLAVAALGAAAAMRRETTDAVGVRETGAATSS